jgi:hypothetical protein
MTLNRRTILVLTLIALCAFVVWDYFFSKSSPFQTVLPAKDRIATVSATLLEKQELLRRPKFTETGDDLFYTLSDKPKIAAEATALKPKQNAVQVRKADLAAPTPIQTTSTAAVTANIAPPVVTPNLGYVAFGQYSNESKRYLLLARNTQTTAVQVGDVLESAWKLVSLNQNIASFQHIPTGLTSQLNIAPLP